METATIEQLEHDFHELRGRLNQARRSNPGKRFADHTLVRSDGPVRLSELFGDADELLVWHNMGRSCPYCTLWADSLTGYVRHLETRCPVVVVSPDAPSEQLALARERGWTFQMVQDAASDFSAECGFYGEHEGTMMFLPGLSAFSKDANGTITQVNKTSFGPGDEFCPVWPALALLPGGAGDWEPK